MWKAPTQQSSEALVCGGVINKVELEGTDPGLKIQAPHKYTLYC